MSQATYLCDRCGKRHEFVSVDLIGKQCSVPGKLVKPRRRRQFASFAEPDGCIILTLPLPVSKNEEPSHYQMVGKLRKQWKELAILAWEHAGSPRFSKVSITPVCFFDRDRGQDKDNYMGHAIKGILDGLKTNLMPDDKHSITNIETMEFEFSDDCPRLELHVRRWSGERDN